MQRCGSKLGPFFSAGSYGLEPNINISIPLEEFQLYLVWGVVSVHQGVEVNKRGRQGRKADGSSTPVFSPDKFFFKEINSRLIL